MKHNGKTLVLLPLFLLATPPAPAAEAFLCVSERVTGFAYHAGEGQWVPTEFNAGRRFVVSRSPMKGVAWQVAQEGADLPTVLCRQDFSSAGTLSCDGGHHFKMNKDNHRFLHAYLLGYWSDRDGTPATRGRPFLFRQGENTPFVEIGTCTPL